MNSISPSRRRKKPSATRFNIQSALVAAIVLAVAASFYGVLIHNVAAQAKPYAQALGISAFACFTIWLVGAVLSRSHAERKLGKVDYRRGVPAFGRELLLGCVYRLSIIIVFFFILPSGLTNALSSSYSSWAAVPIGSAGGIFLASVTKLFLWDEDVWLGENGVIWRSQFYPWSKVVAWRFYDGHKAILELTVRHWIQPESFKIELLRDEVERIEAFMLEKTSMQPRLKVPETSRARHKAMNDEPRTHSTPSPSATRFNIGFLLWLTLAVAVGATVVGFHVRSVEEMAQNHLMAFWLAVLCCFLLAIIYQVISRFRSETRIGKVRFIVVAEEADRSGWFASRPTPIYYGLLFFFWCFLASQMSVDAGLRGDTLSRPLLYGMLASTYAAPLLQNLWWQNSAWIGSRGFIWSTRSFQWNGAEWWDVSEDNDFRVILRSQWGLRSVSLSLHPTVEQGPALTEFLSEAIGSPEVNPYEGTRPIKTVWMGQVIREDPATKPQGEDSGKSTPGSAEV